MNYLELSSKDVDNKTDELYKKISNEYKYDLVVFVAKGSFEIGIKLANLNNCPLLEIKATRKGNKLKKIASPFLKIMPKKLKIFLRNKEFNSNVHEKNIQRNILYNEIIWKKYKDKKNILLVDDSVDTGHSIKCCKNELKKFFSNSNIKVAAFNYFKKSANIVKTDYSIYVDTMLNGPWSNDSVEHVNFVKKYEDWKLEYEKES